MNSTSGFVYKIHCNVCEQGYAVACVVHMGPMHVPKHQCPFLAFFLKRIYDNMVDAVVGLNGAQTKQTAMGIFSPLVVFFIIFLFLEGIVVNRIRFSDFDFG